MKQLPLFEQNEAPSLTATKGGTTNQLSDGVFGWFRYVQDFTGHFATRWINELAPPEGIVWDPFLGSGTTLLAAKLLGYRSYGYDLNPFMLDVAKAKTDWSLEAADIWVTTTHVYEDLHATYAQANPEPLAPVHGAWDHYDFEINTTSVTYPNDKLLRKWISPSVLSRFRALLSRIDSVPNPHLRRFLYVAAASIIIPASNMSFRPNISYDRQPILDYPVLSRFRERTRQMLTDYSLVQDDQLPPATVSHGDARTAGPESATTIFTSPPYPNDMEYVHQTRLELSLLGYISQPPELTTIKKQMISSSVKLVYKQNEWQKQAGLSNGNVRDVFGAISETLAGRNWGWNPADMVAQYFGGMKTVIENWHKRLRPGGLVGCVIGDSAFNGIRVPSDILLADIASDLGFETISVQPFRTRWNSKHTLELRESVIVLERPN